jgi:hypothetical protein
MTTPAPSRFAQGGRVTIVITATADSEWDAATHGGGTHLMLGVRLPDGRLLTVPCDYPGIKVIHGDITPTVLHALADALVYHDEGPLRRPRAPDLGGELRAGDRRAGRPAGAGLRAARLTTAPPHTHGPPGPRAPGPV